MEYPDYTISKYYIKYFKDIYMDSRYNFPPYYQFSRIRNAIAYDIFSQLKISDLNISKYSIEFEKQCAKIKKLSNEDIILIKNLYTYHLKKSPEILPKRSKIEHTDNRLSQSLIGSQLKLYTMENTSEKGKESVRFVKKKDFLSTQIYRDLKL